MFSYTQYNEPTKNAFLRSAPQTLYHNYRVPTKNMDGNFLFEIFKTQNNKPPKNLQTHKRPNYPPSRLRHRSNLHSFSQQKTIKTRPQTSDGRYLQHKDTNQLKNFIENKNQSRHLKTSEDTFIFKKSVDLRDPFFGFQNPQNFQKIIMAKKRYIQSKSPILTKSLQKEQLGQKTKQQTEYSTDCRGRKFKLLQNYLSEIKRNRDELVKKKISISKIKKRISTNNKIMKKKTLDEFLPKLNVLKNDISEKIDINQNEKKQPIGNLNNMTAKSFSIFLEDRIIFYKNLNQRRQIASLTKIMTCITGLFLIQKFELLWQSLIVKVSRQAVQLGGTTANLKPGDQLSLKDLFYGMMLPSGNDAAFAIGQYFGRLLHMQENNQKNMEDKIRQKSSAQMAEFNKKIGLISSKQAMNLFIREMNKISQYLQLTNTYFTNCHGLSDPENLSTAHDLSVLSYHCFQISKFKQIVSTQEYESKIFNKNAKLGRVEKWTNSNLLLFNKKTQCFGGKTGYTVTAGPCLMTCFKIEQKLLIIVLLSCQNKQSRFKETEEVYSKLKNQKKK